VTRTARRPIALALLVLAAAPAVWGAGQERRPAPSLNSVLSAAGSYLREYENQLTFLLAQERYSQRVLGLKGRERARRVMTGELFVTFVPGDQFWISVHDVAEVDGQPVPDREDLQRLLESGSIQHVARSLMERNARFNLGTVRRNFNEPTLALRLLESDHQRKVKFDRKAVAVEDGVTLMTIGFKESAEPTLVRGDDGAQLSSTGDVVIEAETGRVRRTYIRFRHQTITAEMTAVFAPEPKLNLWVPSTFSERYERRDGTEEVIICDSEYTDYRRFESRARIR
jgi:hypothetical protein